MSEIKVTTSAVQTQGYSIAIGTGLLSSVLSDVEKQFGKTGKFVVTDENVASAGHLETLLSGRTIPTFVIRPAGETSKNISTVVEIVEEMEREYLGRDTVVLALGGGTAGDIAGFAAAIFKRGVPVIQIPTTTVAQADSAVGGKTGVDSTVSKNAFGAFWQPAGVHIDVATLKTLDDRQFRAGLVESVKHALIADAEYFGFLESNLDRILQREMDVLEQVAYSNCRIKAAIVQADPTEKNQRRILNYGHTIGHAVESASGFELLHGESVAIGLMAAGLIEIELGFGSRERLEKVRKILSRLGVPTALPENISKNSLIETIRHDKKAINKWPKFVLIDIIGAVHCQEGQWAVDVRQEVVEKVLGKL